MIGILMEHLWIWIIVFCVMVSYVENVKTAFKYTIAFMFLLYGWLGLFYIIIINGGHIPI